MIQTYQKKKGGSTEEVGVMEFESATIGQTATLTNSVGRWAILETQLFLKGLLPRLFLYDTSRFKDAIIDL